MSLPKEPRQKMINIMYLVLTALLALNVSSEILNAFKTVNNSLEKTNDVVTISTGDIMTSLESKLSDSGTAKKAKIWHPVAIKMQGYSASVYEYIQSLKEEILKTAGADYTKKDSTYDEGELNIATRLMVKQGKGKELLKRLTEFKTLASKIGGDSLTSIIEKLIQVNVEKPKSLTGDKKKNWEESYFHMVPTVAALTILSKFQNDIKTSENKVITFCHEQVGKVVLRYDKFEAIVGQNSKYLMPGQDIEITAGLGAFSSAKIPSVSFGGSGATKVENGVSYYTGSGGGMGAHTINVTVAFTDQDGQAQTKTFPVEYVVGQSNASIGLDKMNVLYIGVDNPVTIAASGGGDDKVQASISDGSLTRIGNGKYVARVNNVTDDCKITVNVEGRIAGQQVFRVRTIPEAQCYVGSRPSGDNFTAQAFIAQGGVQAGIKFFPFDLEYNVVSFTFTCDTDDDIVSIPVNGAAFQGAVRNAINQHVKAGRLVTIENIRVKGPDGRTVPAPAIFYNIK